MNTTKDKTLWFIRKTIGSSISLSASLIAIWYSLPIELGTKRNQSFSQSESLEFEIERLEKNYQEKLQKKQELASIDPNQKFPNILKNLISRKKNY
ncbi:unknown; predicted coding region [Mycoplasmopsis pulmonis]|uniref:Uncharacterized protein n=1 Tax=Mycoplasmopsis pulmonis (strain UAB CTIP) TaxID=272635 RepID=Q98QT6_MYCPU|nr:hypothetical protein [Mycoplasmopsis pulmonis]CAC13448.1 unknown; predicted coding region [Mycoplasmopsis pulmonis]